MPVPRLMTITPYTGPQGGLNFPVLITGDNTHFTQAMTTVLFGSGVTPISLIVTSATSMTVVLNISTGAALGTRDITIITGAETVTLPKGFIVTNDTPVQPDTLYLRSREALLTYEDARFNTLVADIPNCYTQVSDSTLWACFVRALAQEMARIEYMLSYDLVALDPQYLTPPDIKRRWAGPLFINKSYPDITTYDINYKAMLVALLHAYPEGSTVQAISDVVQAYTGQLVPIEELYKEIGNGIYDDSDRNTIKISLNASGPNPLAQTVSASRLLILAQNLYTAIDLAKPAHIGLLYSILFGGGEDFSGYIGSLTDILSLVFDGIEPSPLPPIFTYSPFLDPASPDTRLTAYGKRVGSAMAIVLTALQYAALASDDMRAEYVTSDNITYSLNPECFNDILLVDGSGNPTGVVSRAVGVLAPLLDTGWEIKSDELRIYQLD